MAQLNIAATTHSHPLQQSPKVFLSTTSSGAATATATNSNTSSNNNDAKPAPVRDFFLDNLGKIFLSLIAMVVLSLIRSSKGTNNMKAVREELEADSALDPLEINDLRLANSELTLDVFREIMKDLINDDEKNNNMTYPAFVKAVRTTLLRVKGEGVTIGLGYLIDRVVIKALQDRLEQKSSSSSISKEQSNEKDSSDNTVSSEWEQAQGGDHADISMPLSFWLTVLSLALNGPAPDRIRILYEIMELEKSNTTENNLSISSSSMGDKHEGMVTLDDVREIVGHLQTTCQLVPEKQIIATVNKYPVQQYRKGTPMELVQWEEQGKEDKESIDIDAFAGILRSKSVCAWGECYHKKKYVP